MSAPAKSIWRTSGQRHRQDYQQKEKHPKRDRIGVSGSEEFETRHWIYPLIGFREAEPGTQYPYLCAVISHAH